MAQALLAYQGEVRKRGCQVRASSLLLIATLTAATGAAEQPADSPNRLVRDGVAIEFEARPLGSEGVLTEGMFADIRLRLTDATTGQPLAGQVPGAWLDQALPEVQADQCKVRIGTYLKGVLSARPLVDLNSYYLVVMNKDSALTVIDPVTSVGGITSTLTRVALKRPPMDWVASADDRLLYVSMPSAGEVAVVDTSEFKVLGNLPAGPEPVRVALQPDGRYLWVGNNARRGEEGGVTVIDTQTRKTVATLTTGGGHHEIAFSADSRHAFVSSRDAGRVTVVDIATLTGAVVIARGAHATGLLGNDDALMAELAATGERAGERTWPLPMWEEYAELIKSDVADVKNSGGRPAGTITAAMFLREFVEGFPWAHLDVAGTAYTGGTPVDGERGPAGTGTRLFCAFLLARAQ